MYDDMAGQFNLHITSLFVVRGLRDKKKVPCELCADLW